MKATRSNVDLRPTKGNRYTGAAMLTAREAEQLLKMSLKIDKIRRKKNFSVLLSTKLLTMQVQIYDVLYSAGRIK